MKNVIEINDGEFLDAFKDYIAESESIIKEISNAILVDGGNQNLGTILIELSDDIDLLKDMPYRKPVKIHIKTFEYILLDIDNSIATIDQDAGNRVVHEYAKRFHRITVQFRNTCFIQSEN